MKNTYMTQTAYKELEMVETKIIKSPWFNKIPLYNKCVGLCAYHSNNQNSKAKLHPTTTKQWNNTQNRQPSAGKENTFSNKIVCHGNYKNLRQQHIRNQWNEHFKKMQSGVEKNKK